MPGKFERRRRGRQQWVEPAERDWCVRRLQHDQVIVPLGSLTYRQAALVIALLSTVRFITHTDAMTSRPGSICHLRFACSVCQRAPSPRLTSLMNQ